MAIPYRRQRSRAATPTFQRFTPLTAFHGGRTARFRRLTGTNKQTSLTSVHHTRQTISFTALVNRQRMARAGLGVVLVLVVGAAAFWAGRETLQEPETVTPSADSSIVVEVVNEEVGRVITLTTTVTRPETPLAMNALQGVVTHVAEDGERGQGDVLYTVGDTPVVLVAGDTPFWRDLAEGASGDDVQQVQEMLNAQGANLTVDGDWDFAVTSAVDDWPDEHGAEVTGEFELGELVASPTLPVSVSIEVSMAWR